MQSVFDAADCKALLERIDKLQDGAPANGEK